MEWMESRLLLSTTNHLVVTQQATNLVAGNDLSTIAVAVEDSHGNVVADGSSVTLAIAKGPGGASIGGLTTVATVDGVATFTGLSALKAGTYTLAATDGTLRAVTLKKFTVTASTASVLAFTEGPVNSTGRTALGTVEVSVEDAYGNVVTGDHSKVSLAIESGPTGAVLGGTFIANAKNGVAVFSKATLAASGTYVLSASDGDLTQAVSNSFTVSASATQIVFTQVPASAVGQTAFTVKVALEDSTGHVATGDNSKVSLSLNNSPNSHLSGTLTVAAVNGIATFSNVRSIDGTYVLVAKDGKLKSADSSAITVVAGAPVKLAIVSTFTGGTATGDLTEGTVGPITVAVEDALGNIVTSTTARDANGSNTEGSTVTLVLNTTLSTEATIGTVTQAATATATVTSGLATFTGLATEATGWYQLIVTDGALTQATQLIYVR
jgi:hypothetical protein